MKPTLKLEHEFVVSLEADDAWDLLLDIERVAACFPGASLTDIDGDSFSGTVGVRLGPIAMKYQGAAKFVSKDAHSRIALVEARGKESSGAGGAKADVRLSLNASGPAATKVTVDTDLTITGRPAQFGRGVIVDVSDNLLKQFTKNLEAQLLAHEGPSRVADPATAPAESLDMAALMLRALSRRSAPWLVGAASVAVVVLAGRRRARPAQ